MLRQGEVLQNTYRIEQEIGAGGTGIIYLATHLHLQKSVVVKKIKEHCIGNMDVRGEVDILKKLHHAYLPQVYDFLQAGDVIYTVMEFIEGRDLQYYIDQGIFLAEKELRCWLAQLLDVLQYLHQQSPPVFHSDIKPANIMITPQGNICLIDFNISLIYEGILEPKGLSGGYSAPEQYARAAGRSGVHLDERMDIYSLGATYYRILTGCIPPSDLQELRPIRYFETPYSDGLVRIIEKAMAVEPQKRYRSAVQMKKALDHIHKKDIYYRRLQLCRLAVAVASALFLITGTLCCYYGSEMLHKEQYLEAYREFSRLCQEQEFTAANTLGMELLNKNKYRRYLTGDGQKSSILQKIGENYFFAEDYEKAAEYYEMALAEDGHESIYYRDYAIVLARLEREVEAEIALRTAEREGLGSNEIRLVQAELYKMAGNTEEAIQILTPVWHSETDRDILEHSYLLAAAIYEQDDDHAKQVEMLNHALQQEESLGTLRKLAAALTKLAEKSDDKEAILKEALKISWQAVDWGADSYRDELNLAIVMRASGEYEESRVILERLAAAQHSDYQIYLNLAIVYYQLWQSGESDIDKNLIIDICNKALQYYRGSGETDTAIEQIEQIRRNLTE